METTGFIECDARDTLVALEVARATRDTGEQQMFALAAHWVDLHAPDTPGPSRDGTPGTHAQGRLPGTRGTTRPVHLAGPGTPAINDLAIAEFAAEAAMSSGAARYYLGDALETRHRLPLLWARVSAGEVRVHLARKVAQTTRALTLDQAGFVDAAVAWCADGRLPYTRFETLLEAKVIEADPTAAAAREHAAATQEFAKIGRSNDHGHKTLYLKTGAAQITRIDATITYLAHALKTLGGTGNLDQRRVTATALLLGDPVQALQLLLTYKTHQHQAKTEDIDGEGDGAEDSQGEGPRDEDEPLPTDDEPTDPDDETGAADCADGGPHGGQDGEPSAELVPAAFRRPLRPLRFRPDLLPPCPTCTNPPGASEQETSPVDWARLLPAVTLYLHVSTTGLTDPAGGVVRWEGETPVTTHYLRHVLGPHARFTIKPVLDPTGQTPVDAYETPTSMREIVHLRTPADCFPYAVNTTRTTDLDHSVPHDQHAPPDTGDPPDGQGSGDPPRGRTEPGNLGPLTRYHHRVKTHTTWQVRQPFPGIYLWRAPHGTTYLVDHTGTRKLHGPTQATAEGTDPAQGTTPPTSPAATSPSRLEDHFTDLITRHTAA